jgi:hypothetical protein
MHPLRLYEKSQGVRRCSTGPNSDVDILRWSEEAASMWNLKDPTEEIEIIGLPHAVHECAHKNFTSERCRVQHIVNAFLLTTAFGRVALFYRL